MILFYFHKVSEIQKLTNLILGNIFEILQEYMKTEPEYNIYIFHPNKIVYISKSDCKKVFIDNFAKNKKFGLLSCFKKQYVFYEIYLRK